MDYPQTSINSQWKALSPSPLIHKNKENLKPPEKHRPRQARRILDFRSMILDLGLVPNQHKTWPVMSYANFFGGLLFKFNKPTHPRWGISGGKFFLRKAALWDYHSRFCHTFCWKQKDAPKSCVPHNFKIIRTCGSGYLWASKSLSYKNHIPYQTSFPRKIPIILNYMVFPQG